MKKEKKFRMPKNILLYDLLISCPGDIKSEIEVIEEVVEAFNQQFATTLGISIRTRHWSKSAYAQSGGKPQELLNKQFVDNCDAAVALFWTRFGTPTDKYGSGSEEEIENMIGDGKQVFVYFSEKPVNLSECDFNQYQKVKDFKDKYKSKGLFYCYNSDEELRKLFYAHLSQYFLTLKQITTLVEQRSSKLLLKAICNGEIKDSAEVVNFDFNGIENREERLNRIRKLFGEILKSPVKKCRSEYNISLGYKKVEILEEKVELISKVAEFLEIELNESFFALGMLRENMFNNLAVLGGGRSLEGKEEEKEKYNNILRLYDTICSFSNWCSVEECFGGMKAIKLCLANEGTMYDEDIDIELYLPNNMLLSHREFRIPKEGILSNLEEDNSLNDLFEIKGTESYIDYESSCKPFNQVYVPDRPSVFPFGGRDYEEEYRNDLDDIFCYKIYEKGNEIIVKLHIDYIKQHSAVAFPTPLFLKDINVYNDIRYKIISKNNASVISGDLQVKAHKMPNVEL